MVRLHFDETFIQGLRDKTEREGPHVSTHNIARGPEPSSFAGGKAQPAVTVESSYNCLTN